MIKGQRGSQDEEEEDLRADDEEFGAAVGAVAGAVGFGGRG